MADIQLMHCKNQQKTSSNCRNIVPYKEIGVKESNGDVRINSCFCACAVKIWLKLALNAVKLAKFEAVNRKSWSPRTMVVKDLWQHSRLPWFCSCAESCVVFSTGPYTVLADNSICLNRSAISCKNRQIGVKDFKYVWKICPLRTCHVIWHMRSGCKRTVNGILWEMSELITQERIAVGSLNLEEGLTMWPTMYYHWPKSKGQGHKVT